MIRDDIISSVTASYLKLGNHCQWPRKVRILVKGWEGRGEFKMGAFVSCVAQVSQGYLRLVKCRLLWSILGREF